MLSVTIRLRGDSYGEIFTTSATFQYVSPPLPPPPPTIPSGCCIILSCVLTIFSSYSAYDGLQNQIQSCLYKNFGKGAIGIATPRGKVITEDWQIYQLAYLGFSTSFCNVVYAREDQKIHSRIILPAAKVLVEVNKKDPGRAKSSVFMYLDPNESYSTKYIDQPGLSTVLPENKGVQEDLAVGKGYYYKDMQGLPSYDDVNPSARTFGKACYSKDCECCQGWIRSQRGPEQRVRPSGPRWKGIELQDYDGLTLAERRYLLGGKRR